MPHACVWPDHRIPQTIPGAAHLPQVAIEKVGGDGASPDAVDVKGLLALRPSRMRAVRVHVRIKPVPAVASPLSSVPANNNLRGCGTQAILWGTVQAHSDGEISFHHTAGCVLLSVILAMLLIDLKPYFQGSCA